MHGTSPLAPVVLSGDGGLVTLAKPDSVPEGASPRTYDGDYEVGGWKTRAGLTNRYAFAEGVSLGPDPGGAAVDTPLAAGGAAWANPGNALLNTGVYATATMTAPTATVIATQGFVSGTTKTLVVYFSSDVSSYVGAGFDFSGLMGATWVNGQTLAAAGTYGTNSAMQFDVSSIAPFVTDTGTVPDTGSASIAASTDALDITHFNFSVPATSAPRGFGLAIIAYASEAATLNVQMLAGGVPRGTAVPVPLNVGSPTTLTLGGIADLFGGAWTYSDLNNTEFGIRITANGPVGAVIHVGYSTLQTYLLPAAANFQYVTTFTAQDGSVRNIAIDASGNFWYEDLTNNPGVLNLATEGLATNALVTAINGTDVEYVTFCDGKSGSDMPLQYTKNWIDRITQVGPGAAPSFTPLVSGTDTYAIASITQLPAKSDPGNPGKINTLMQSAGPTSTAPGNVVTVFYALSLDYPQDSDLVNAFNSGNAVYVYVAGTSLTAANGTFLVTSIGNVIPPGGGYFRWYFTYQVAGAAAYQKFGSDSSPGTYQQTLATITTSVTVPGLTVGNSITISGSSVTSWDSTWPITQALSSSQMVITGSEVTASVATFNYSLSGGSTAAPVAGQLVTITNTTNGNGLLNGTNLTIVYASGGTIGTFKVDVSVATASFAPEDGYASTAGTIFAFDPGINVIGTTTNPIYGNATGGTLIFIAATAQLIGVGTRKGSVIFITRNGYYTAPAPPVTFTCPENTTAILVSEIPIGPPNVIARGIIITEPGQNGVPGANFYTIPTPVTYIVENVSYTATSLLVQDNTSTSATFSFTDSVLLNALAVDVYGYNLFNQIEIGDPGWVISYATRNLYGLCRNKIQNFLNLSFDGGYLSNTTAPLGWSLPDQYGGLIASAKFGNSYYIQNTTDGTLAVAGMIQQSAYQDAYLQTIISPNTAYSVRITAAIPSGLTTGNLVVSLSAGGSVFGSFTLPFASMTTNYKTYTGTLLTTDFVTVPTNLQLVVEATEIGAGADVEIDRFDVFPTAIPVLGTTVYGSYAGLPEQVDAVTGEVIFASENQQPVNGAMVLYDTFYGLKGWGGTTPGSSLYSLQKDSNLEPAQWDEPEVAQRSGGACGPLAFDLGEQWFVGASRAGIYLFVGGQPGKINQEIYQVWDAINWTAAATIWIKVDITHRRIYVGVPMPTPNFWLPNAPVNAAPTSPNVILMCNFQGLDSGQELKSEPQMHTTMFGTLNAIDMRRKWSLWQIPAPYANFCAGVNDEEFQICNGRGNSKIYMLDDTNETDDGAVIDSLYTTAGLVELSKRAQAQGVGGGRIRWGHMVASMESAGNVQVKLYPNRLLGPGDPTEGYNAWQMPGGITPGKPAFNDAEANLNFAATRTYIEFRENDGHGFTLSNLALEAKQDPWNAVRGRTGV